MRELKQWQASVDIELKQLSTRIRAVGVDISDLKRGSASLSTDSPGTDCSGFTVQLRSTASHCNDTENWVRCCNLVFLGLPDNVSETWSLNSARISQTLQFIQPK